MKRALKIVILAAALFWAGWQALIYAAVQMSDPAVEFAALKADLEKIDYSAPPAVTDGWSNIEAAEWPLFSLVYWGYAGCHLARKFPEKKADYVREVDWAISRLMTPRITGFITPHFGDPLAKNLIQPSVLVHGHLFFLLMQRRALDGDKKYDARLHDWAAAFAASYQHTPSGVLPSYPGMWWPTDNLPALAALKLYDQTFGTKLSDSPCTNWVRSIRDSDIDRSTGLFCAYYNPHTRTPISGPRGVSLMFAFPFLKIIDPVFATEQFALAKKHLVGEALGMTAVREFPEGQKETPDVDSGVLIMGFGPAASGFGIASAAAMGDSALFDALLQSKALAVLSAKSSGLDQNILPPVGRCVILFGETHPLK